MNNHSNKKDAELVVGYVNHDPEGRPVYHPIIAKFTLIGAVFLGVLLGWLAYMVASGVWPIRDLGQFSASDNVVATFVGASVGVALGGLIGSIMGVFRMLHKS
ncbi:hypothetical protein MKJ04_00930 [Pontibacter sp. E15-1]|uniref:hypothetical protein n=1 Tax=Pontibacter sp. E15-1 TaxID=2919918 RepID=UPI001F4F9F1F|nr:hypothetical protein [Pontibacter sp. E15-1]MCJ8163386.1 hypothetical protein [Pontibacter sp. E15-1]